MLLRLTWHLHAGTAPRQRHQGLIRRFPCGRADPFRSVRDLGRASLPAVHLSPKSRKVVRPNGSQQETIPSPSMRSTGAAAKESKYWRCRQRVEVLALPPKSRSTGAAAKESPHIGDSPDDVLKMLHCLIPLCWRTYCRRLGGVAVARRVSGQAGSTMPANQGTVNNFLSAPGLTKEYFDAILKDEVTIDDVARTRLMLYSTDTAARNLANNYWPAVRQRYFRGARGTYYIGHYAPWGIVLHADGHLDYEYPVEIASLVDAKWEILVHECSEAIEEAAKVLQGRQRQLHCLRLFAQLHALFSAIDSVVNQPDSQVLFKRLEDTLKYADKKIEELSRSLRDLAAQTDRRVAQQWYLIGMLPGLGVVALMILAASKLPHVVSNADLEVALSGGAVGALLSVLGRTTRAQFSKTLQVDTQAGTPLIVSAGAFRPIVGALVALVIYVLIEAGLLPIKIPDYPQSLFFIPAISFLAGFSERLAQDALVSTSVGTFGIGRTKKNSD